MLPFSRYWIAEACVLGRIALAVTIAMLAQFTLGMVETLLVARLGTEALAGASLAFGLHLLVFLLALGVVTAITPFAASAVGRGDHEEACRIGQAGLFLGLIVSLPGAALLLVLAVSINSIFGHGPELDGAAGYLLGAAPGLPAWVCYVALRSLAAATNTVRVTTAAMLAVVPAHAVLATWFVLGGLGLPSLGPFGAGLAHSAAGYLVLVFLAGFLRGRPGSALAVVLAARPSWDRARCGMLIRFGLPFACRILLREGVMPAATLLLVSFGPAAVASHAVAARIAALLGIVAFGISQAANVRVGHALGAGRPRRVARSAWIVLQLSVLVGGIAAAIPLVAPSVLVTAILGNVGLEEVEAVTVLMPFVAAFLLLEIVMAAAGGVLNGLRDAKGPLVIAVVGAWLVGLPLGLLLASVAATPAFGVWCGLVAGAALTALLLFSRMRRRLRASQHATGKVIAR